MEIGRKTEKKNAPCNADKHVFHFLGKRFHSHTNCYLLQTDKGDKKRSKIE